MKRKESVEYYNWDKNLQILVYGVNSYSQKLVEQLRKMSFEICAYIDRRAEELVCIDGIPVIDMNNGSLNENAKNKCAIIMLMNAMQHDQIALNLFHRGIQKIIFVPMEFRYSTKSAYQLREIYNSILLGDFEAIRQIPYYEKMIQDCQSVWKKTLYKKTSEFVTVNVIADIIYTNPKEAIINERENLLAYADVPLIAYKPYNQMFAYFSGGGKQDDDIFEYLNDYGVNRCKYTHSYTNESIVIQRAELYEIWNEHFQEGLDFFVSSAPLAKWNDRGFFNLLEGHHRTLFLLKKGIYYLPLRISREDWRKWQNTRIANKIRMDEQTIYSISPIQNPYFQKESFYNKISIIESMLSIQQNLLKETYSNGKVLSVDSILGYYGFHFRRMGADSVFIYAKEDGEREITEKISQLYGLKEIHTCNAIDWKIINQFSLISVIGTNAELTDIKIKLLQLIDKLKVVVLISLTEAEQALIGNKGNFCLTAISKVFMEKEMVKIYLLQR